jgi:hypothetical protein
MPAARKSSRTEKTPSELRSDRAMKNRSVTENRELTDSERLDMFRKSLFQSSLPDLPKISGYHVCWLTTTNPRDSIQGRLRLGYELIRAEDVPGWEHATIKSADYVGCVGINEMIAAKLPLHLYNAYMTQAHHQAPLEEESKLEYANQEVAERAAKESKRERRPLIMVEEGMQELGQAPPAPDFAAGEE